VLAEHHRTVHTNTVHRTNAVKKLTDAPIRMLATVEDAVGAQKRKHEQMEATAVNAPPTQPHKRMNLKG
jgi:hypothetical protein